MIILTHLFSIFKRSKYRVYYRVRVCFSCKFKNSNQCNFQFRHFLGLELRTRDGPTEPYDEHTDKVKRELHSFSSRKPSKLSTACISQALHILNMGLSAAELLVTELAAGRAGIGFVQSEDQKELNIPAFLVYLLGVVLAEDNFLQITKGTPKAVASARERRFKEFQQQYLDAGGDTSSVVPVNLSSSFKMTTRVLPNKAQQDIIVNDLMKQVKNLHLAALKAAQSLIEDEKALQKKESAKLIRREKRKAKQRAKKNNEVPLKENGEDGKKTDVTEVESKEEQESEEEKPKEESSSEEITNNSDGGAGMESSLESSAPIGGKELPLNPTADQVLIQDETRNTSKDEGLELLKDIGCDTVNESVDDSNMDEASSTLPNEVFGAEMMRSLLDDLNIPRLLRDSPSKLNTSIDENNIHHPPNNDLIQRIANLENELEEANRRSEEERLAHTKALRNQKERYENLIQSLQLRLYISENKVRTYEEALEQHIAAISTINRNSTFVKPNAEERIPGSPSLISKVLQSTRMARNEEA